MFHANTTATVYRGTTTNEFGDTIDTDTTILTGTRMSIIEQSRTVFVPADNENRVVRFVRGRTLSNVDLREGDRIQDEQTGVVYVVEAVVNPGSPYSSGDVRVNLKYVT